jgi:hypothetical protein
VVRLQSSHNHGSLTLFNLQMTYLSDAGQELVVHAHPCDRTCHWADILRPLAFTIFCDAQLTHIVVQSSLRKGSPIDAFGSSYAKWLCRVGEGKLLNIVLVFLLVLQLRGPPSHDISARLL